MGERTEKKYSTAEIAGKAGVHPNTVRLYEKWGFISVPGRTRSNYRIFEHKHIVQMEFARLAVPGPYPVDTELVRSAVRAFACSDFQEALRLSEEYLSKTVSEIKRSEDALETLKNWIENKTGDDSEILVKTRKSLAVKLDVTLDALRTWERNGLFISKRNESNVLVFTERDTQKTKIIRLLRNCGYSIASLLNVFSKENLEISDIASLLNKPDEEFQLSYVTDRFIPYLYSHQKRAEDMMRFVNEYIK